MSESLGAAAVHALASPPSFAQERLWFVDRLAPGNPAYNMAGAMEVLGPLDVDCFSRSLGECVQRHEALRTCFLSHDGVLSQVVVPDMPLPLTLVDLSGLPAADRDVEELIDRLAAEEAAHPFQLDRVPLLRARLLRVRADRHVLLVTFHHIISDEWSLDVFVRELAVLYQARRAGRPHGLAPLTLHYADYAAWQREQAAAGALDPHLAYWRAKLTGLPSLDLPTDWSLTRRRDGAYPGAAEQFEIGAALSRRLRGFSRREGVSLFTALCAAFQLMLRRWTGQTDIVVGTPVANRNRLETQEMLGFFANILILRTGLDGDPTYRAALHRTARTCREAFDNQETPFEQLVSELEGERDARRNPLVQAVFQVVNTPLTHVAMGDVRLEQRPARQETAVFDLLCTLTDDGDRITGELRYASDLWNGATIRTLTGLYLRVLEAMAAAPDERVTELALLPEPEHDCFSTEVDTPLQPPDEPAAADRCFARQARLTPGAVAVTDGDLRWTYAELDERADRMANALLTAGVRPETAVALCLERSAELIAWMLGVVKAGATYAVCDPGLPVEHLAALAERMGLSAVVTGDEPAAALRSSPAPVLSPRDAQGASATAPASRSHPEGLAGIVLSTGPTGRPEGVGLSHRAVTRLAADPDHMAVTPDDIVLCAADPASDTAVVEVWGALLNGGRIAVVPGPSRLPPGRLADAIRDLGATVVLLGTPDFHRICGQTPEAFDAVRHLLVSGEPMDPGRAAALLNRARPPRLSNVYQVTEAAVLAAGHPLPGPPAPGTGVPIGRPVRDTALYVLDPGLRPLPVGVPGELFAGGPGLARGYLGRPDLTAERFLPDPFHEIPGGRMYRTGDRARLLPDGSVECLGRLDGPVGPRGHRLVPGEIESVLRTWPQIEDCVVVPVEHDGDRSLAAYVVAAPDTERHLPELRSALKAALPPHLLPRHFVRLDGLPLTRNGRVDHGALPDVRTDAAAESGSRAPGGEVEQELRDIWAKALDVPEIGADGNFFLLGGHSLLATTMIEEVRRRFGIDLPLRCLFEAPVLSELAREIERRQAVRGSGSPGELNDLLADLERMAADHGTPGHGDGATA